MSLAPSTWTDETLTASNWTTSDGSTRLATYSDPTITYSQVLFPYIGKVIPITSSFTTDSTTPSSWSDV